MTRPALYLVLLLTSRVSLSDLPGAAAIDARVRAAMAETRAKGMAARAEWSSHPCTSVRRTSFPTSRLIYRRPNSVQTSRRGQG